jgi:cytochrome c556
MGFLRFVAGLTLMLAMRANAEEPAVAPADVIRYRQLVMRGIASHLKALAPVAARKVNYPKHATIHANALADVSKIVGDLFPAGTGAKGGETDALDAIWQKPKAWAAAVEKFRAEAEKLGPLAAAGDLDALRTQVEVTNDACAACHKSFRAAK